VGHLAVLALIGFILTEVNLIGFYKVPFTCSYLPGKSNVQSIFWGFLIGGVTIMLPLMSQEWRSLHDPIQYAELVIALAAVALGLWAFNRHRAKSAMLYFEELPDEVITTLGLISH
jgi:UDP-N-acetylmuramyl pentapeptide phosphotransferase/UDP-N-acetylglucosamine-1-phosphate transferase